MTGSDPIPVTLTVNGRTYRVFAEPRRLLSDVLREDCGHWKGRTEGASLCRTAMHRRLRVCLRNSPRAGIP